MNSKFIISLVTAFVIAMGGSFVVHGVILKPEYVKLTAMFRSEADAAGYGPFMLLAHVFIALGLVWIYRQGASGGPWALQGIRFALAIICVATIPMYLIYYAVQPLPGDVVVKQIVGDSISLLVNGLVIAFINKPADAA